MYTTHYGLTAKPFSIVPDPNILFLSKTHENALTYLEYGLSEKVGFVLLTGEIGIGKTTLIRHILNKMSSKMDIAAIFNTNLSSEDLFRLILSEFEIPCDTADKSIHLETFYHFLIEQFARGRHTLLIIDEAQNLSDEVLEDIRMLFNLQTDNNILLQIILVGQPELRQRMTSPGMRQLAQRISVNYHLSPLTDEQTYQYINYRLKTAGAADALFSPEAMNLIYEKSAGIPRTINLLCDAGLVYGYAENKSHIDRSIIENVLRDRICLSVTPHQDQPLPTPIADAVQDGPATEFAERLAAIEAAFADLQYGQEKFMQEIRSEFDQKFEELKNASAENSHSRLRGEADNQPVAEIYEQPDLFAFKDSAVAHTLEYESEGHPHETAIDDSDYRPRTLFIPRKPDLRKLFRKRVLPYLDMSYTWAKCNVSRKFGVLGHTPDGSACRSVGHLGGERSAVRDVFRPSGGFGAVSGLGKSVL